MELHGVCIYTADAPRLAAFYQAVLGEAPLCEGTHYTFARARLAVYDPGHVRRTRHKTMSLMFAVFDVQAAFDRIVRDVAGVSIISPPLLRPWGAFSCQLLDPDGNLFALVEQRPPLDG